MKAILLIKLTILTHILYPLTAYTQTERTVTGIIHSTSDKQPIQGVSISSKSTGRVVLSNARGEFVFANIAESDTLSFKYLGYMGREIHVAVIGQQPIEVYLEESLSELGEVVVNTGYQSLPRERATGSFTQIDNELFNRSISTDLISRLEGVTNGLSYELPRTYGEPSTAPNLRIRGLSTINGEVQPLIVVDNFPYEGDISNINPNDVESITVLKDAAAASIWGARAGNGVIVVTTKKGRASRSPLISFNSNATISERPDLHYYRNFLPPAEAVELERLLYQRGLYAKNDWTAVTPAVEVLFSLEDGLMDENTANSMLNDLKRFDIRDDASRYLYRQGVNQQYAVNINGGSESHNYYLSAGLDNNAENLIGNGYKRLTLSAKNDFRPTDKLQISSSINYMQSNSMNNGIGIVDLAPNGLSDVYVYARLKDESGNPLAIVRNNRYSYTESVPEIGLLDWHYRPLDEIRTSDNTSGSQEIRVNTSAMYQLLQGLNVEARYQYQNISNSTRSLFSQDSYYARDLINQFTQPDGARPIPLGGILDRSGNTFVSHYGRFQLAYNSSFGDRHELNGLAGFELRQERNVGNGSSRLYGYDDDVLSYASNLDYYSFFPTRPNWSNQIPDYISSGNQTTDRFVSYYTNLAYTYDNRYIVSGSVRWDASNIFGVDFNQKGVPLWSVGTAWNITSESFFDIDWVSLAKLRLTYGANGNAVRTLSSLPYVQFGYTNPASRLPAARLISVGNPDLSWEQVNTVNLGLDFSVFNNRVSGSLEWYNKASTNLIGDDIIDPTTGIIPIGSGFNLDNRRNYADMETRGLDIELNTVNIDGKFKWQTTLLLSHVKNRVTNYYTQRNAPITSFFDQFVAPTVVEGASIDQLYAIPWYGLDGAGSPLVMVNGQLGTDYSTYFNNLTQEDLLKVGVSMPTYFGSLRNTFTWHGLSASVNILWKAGYKFRRESVNYSGLLGTSHLTHIDYLDRWQSAGDEQLTNVPSMPQSVDLGRDQAYLFSEALIERGDHIRLQDITLSYQLPQRYVRNFGLSQVRLYGNARNLGVIWKHTDVDIDPDVRALYPQPFQISFGLQIQF